MLAVDDPDVFAADERVSTLKVEGQAIPRDGVRELEIGAGIDLIECCGG